MIRPRSPVITTLTAMVLALLMAIPSIASAADLLTGKREGIEWIDIWVVHGNQPKLTPRILLIGDSITRAYYDGVRKELEAIGPCDRLATSAALCDPALIATVELVMSQHHYDVIHFNNGMHGWDYTEAEYGTAIAPMLATLRRLDPHAKLIWATTTPTTGRMSDKNPRIDERNRLVIAALANKSVAIDDLHALVAADTARISADGVHMTPTGSAALAAQVAASIKAVLAQP